MRNEFKALVKEEVVVVDVRKEIIKLRQCMDANKIDYVEVNLWPVNGEWWHAPDTNAWAMSNASTKKKDWFDTRKKEYIAKIENELIAWWHEHVHVGENIHCISDGLHLLYQCTVGNVTGVASVYMCNSSIDILDKDATVIYATGTSVIHNMNESAKVEEIDGESCIMEMRDESSVDIIRGGAYECC